MLLYLCARTLRKKCTKSGMIRRNGQREEVAEERDDQRDAVVEERDLQREAVQGGVEPIAIEAGQGMPRGSG